jgi:hypothetical protein
MDPEAYLWSVMLHRKQREAAPPRYHLRARSEAHTGTQRTYSFLRRGNGPDPRAAVHDAAMVSNETCKGA